MRHTTYRTKCPIVCRPGHQKAWLLIGLLLCLTSGCGSDQIPAWPTRGMISFEDGTPVRTGVIELESVSHDVTATGRIQEDGTFVLGTYGSDDGAVAGQHRVIVMQFVISDGTINHTTDHGQPVDRAYASYETSGLTATVVPDQPNVLTVFVTAAEAE